MADEEGLPLPAPKAAPKAKPGADDLDVKMIRDEFNQIGATSSQAIQAHADKVTTAAQAGAPMKLPDFKGDGPGLLTNPESELYQAMKVDPKHTGVGDMLKSVGAGMGYMYSHPWTAYKDKKVIAQINVKQSEFIAQYTPQLTQMSEELATLTRSMTGLGQLLHDSAGGFNRVKLDQIMKEKATCGDAELTELGAEVYDAKGDDKVRLRKAYDDFQTWINQRDARIARERPVVEGLAGRVVALGDQCAAQFQVLDNAGRAHGPANTTGGGKIIDSTHIRPESIDYARAQRDILAGSRARIDGALSGPAQAAPTVRIHETKTAGGGARRVGLVAAAALAVAALLGGGALFLANSGGRTSSSEPAAQAKPSPSPSPSPASSPSPGRRLTGSYSGSIATDSSLDPNGHAAFIGPMPTALDVMVTRNTQTGSITVQVKGAPPFIQVLSIGNYSTASGAFSASGAGPVTDRKISVTAKLDGNLIDGKLTGTLTFTGTPNGPISYRIDMTEAG
jgi:hypothetical protein